MVELPVGKPKNWSDVAENYEAIQKQMAEHVKELALKHPEQRAQALSELNPLIKELKVVAVDLEKLNNKWFLTPDRKVTELGAAGRAVWSDLFALPRLNNVISVLEQVADSLEVKCDGKAD